MTEITDREARLRFAHEQDRNFSVIASAGSGKTRAISNRIVELARRPFALERLPQLVVVTYTNRAADEMQQRTRQQILEAGLSLDVIEAFNRAFFGTIHSFCVKLLTAYGHHLGLPAQLELITNDSELWNQFVQQQTRVGHSLSDENRQTLLRHVQMRDLMELARNCEIELNAVEPQCPCPDADFSRIYQAPPKGNSTRTIPKDQINLRRWEERWRSSNGFVPWPPRSCNAREFVRQWRDAFGPLREWVNACAFCVASEVQRAYRDFRFERGLVTYADQVALAVELIHQPHVARQIRQKNYRVILDEAQDTAPQQFLVLTEIARPPEATALWPEQRDIPPRPGHFSMVGDFQQSIYRSHADLAQYRTLHERLVEGRAAEQLTLSVTFRLDQAQLDFVNATFPSILSNTEGQVEFVELHGKGDILPGQVIRLDLEADAELPKGESQRAAVEARQLAKWLRDQGLAKLRAESWREVAILSPRKAWLRLIRDALVTVDLPAEVQSESDLEAENPAYAWLTALLTIMIEPSASYEIVGVLREVFGLSDDELARFSQGIGARFQIAEKTNGYGAVATTLNLLKRVRQTIAQQPLFSAICELVRMTHLSERLHSLPPATFPTLGPDLDNLLSEAGAAEARGVTLPDFVRTLRTRYSAIRETNPSTTNAIQLITAHKAKGSEWQAVLVPFLTRKVQRPNRSYPYLLEIDGPAQPQIVFDKTDADEFRDELELTERQEMERLLYVAFTRAKHTLVLAVDRKFFPKANETIHPHSQFKWLRTDATEPNEKALLGLPSILSTCVETARHQQAQPRLEARESLGLREVGWVDRGRQSADHFVRVVVPSKLTGNDEATAKEEWLEVEPQLRRPRLENPAIRYGIWWHNFAQQVPWADEPRVWEEIFVAAQEHSPDKARSRREWSRLRKRIGRFQDLVGDWSSTSPVIRSELPFFWKMPLDSSLEGVIDLAIIDPETGRWVIIDWKTNHLGPKEIENLRIKYRPQLAAYWQIAREFGACSVQAALFSTATSEFLRYEESELGAEWERLKSLPPQQLMDEFDRP